MRTSSLVRLLLIGLLLAGCESTQIRSREAGALTGGALGAGLGAIVGNQHGRAGEGVAIGGAIGALSGALIGNSMDNQDAELQARDQRLAEQDRQIRENQRMIDELKSKGIDARDSDRGVIVNLPDVLFEFDSARLTPRARSTARDISNVLSTAQGRRISVEGHTDSVGTMAYNQRLSESRARSVAGELVANGISRRRISTEGYGETQPVATNSTSEGRQRNRRVEVIIQNY